MIHPALPGEGVWHPTFVAGGSRPPVLVTSSGPSRNYPQNVAGVAWIDHTRTSVWLYPGRLEPSVSMASRGPMEVPLGAALAARRHLQQRLQAGRLRRRLRDRRPHVRAAEERAGDDRALPRRQRGRAGLDRRPGRAGPNIVYARQNLPLIVNNGQLNPNLSDGPQWGATLGNAIRVWRSGVGVDRHGNLIYAAANDQTVGSLAEILRRAGAVRAMELDINTYWTSFITYRHPGAIGAANLLASMDRSPQRYLTPDDRDFFAVYIR